MSLTIEFTESSVTFDEIAKLQRERRISLREKPQLLPSGNVGFFLSYARLPAYVFQSPKILKERSFCDEYGVRLTYREEIRDDGALSEGEYSYGDGIDMMVVQHGKDRELVEKISNVEIIGTDLEKMSQAFQHLRSGKLTPTIPYASSPGTVSASTVEESEDKEGGSGEHPLPSEAATEEMTAA